KLTVEMLDLVKLGKQVENDFIGVNSGIMDQFAIGMGKKDHGILLNTNTLAYELVSADFLDYVIVIMNTNKRRELADSKYNERRSECEAALELLKEVAPINELCELDMKKFEKINSIIDNPTLLKRARHAISENERTLLAKEALVAGELSEFGLLLNASHKSLKEDYEVTGVELDTLVDAAQQVEGVLGARMTGAGFGGCAIALVP
ncbi:galactokinase, partial [Acinetobacter baumannii]|nr:galactokinase [Acinetobacter baumannii]